MTEKTLKLLKEFTEIYAPSSYEERARDYMKEKLKGNCDEVIFDKRGSLIAVKKSKVKNAPKLMLMAHLDEIGFMITGVDSEGFATFKPLGGWWPMNMMGHRVIIHANRGKDDYMGVITTRIIRQSPAGKQLKDLSLDMLRIDFGAKSKEEAKEFGIIPGTFVSPHGELVELLGGKRIVGKAFDNRAGCALIVELMEAVKDLDLPCDLYAGGTCEEEGGVKTAACAVNMVKPDIFLAVDCSHARDMGSKDENSRLGDGFLLRFLDGKMRPHAPLKDYMADLAEEKGINYQLFNSLGGTDAAAVQSLNDGVLTGVVGIACRYNHSNSVIMEKSDYDSALEMLIALAQNVDEAVFKKLTDY